MKKENKLKQTRTRISNEEKLKLMTEYMKETGKNITTNTVYKGYNIGYMRNNLRQMYFKGKLKIDKELLKKFIESGIITNFKEKIRTSYQEKYDFLMSLVGKKKEELLKSKMKRGLSYLDVKYQMQIDYNRGKLRLSDNQIKELRKAGFLGYSKDEIKEISKVYRMPDKFAIDILKKYDTKEKFIEQYKKELCDYDFENKIFCGFRGIAVSNHKITEFQKFNYALLVKDIVGENLKFGYSTRKYIDIDKIDNILQCLKEKERKVIRMHYGLDGQKFKFKVIEEELGMARGRSGQIKEKVLEKLSKLDTSLILQDNKKEQEELNKCKDEYEETINYIKDINIIKLYITNEKGKQKEKIQNIKLTEMGISIKTQEKFAKNNIITIQNLIDKYTTERKAKIQNMSIEELEFTVRTFNCLKRVGVRTLYDLMNFTDHDLLTARNFGRKSYDEVIKKLDSLGIRLRYENEDTNISINDEETDEQFKARLEVEDKPLDLLEKCNREIEKHTLILEEIVRKKNELENNIERYNKAVEKYLREEDIFDAQFIV